MTIDVGNLPREATRDNLTTLFSKFGKVIYVAMISSYTDRETGKPRGFAFIDMGSDTEEEKAIAELDGAEWMGRTLKVNKARPREN
ncbi:hypothetical protein C1752_03362 [Acaryochloris thomasi RCC1774]|uniref:RRM domain-containing protein n=1 Tax=Acaryochloris thomasi RCC1774 TaxID=1764569 RepID=A0A2W1JH27_9CYAN|nr:RNA-binding protein [Acaryochloris thomasi]PZD72893.1 hypothetical protein C1752_03362 [Acaryochloris thomasi RCC1774]